MRVLQVYKTSYPYSYGGVEQVIHQLALGTSTLGIDNTVFSLHAPTAGPLTQAPPAYETVSLPRLGQVASMDFSFNAFNAFDHLAQQVDLIHYHFPWPFMDLLQIWHAWQRRRRSNGQTRKSVPALVTYHSDIVRQRRLLQLYAPLRDRFLHKCDRIIATSPAYVGSSPVLQAFAGKVQMIPIGIEDLTVQPAPVMSVTLATRLAQQGYERFLLFVGALRAYKGLSVLLDAMRGIDLPLIIAGDGPERVALQAQAERLGLQHIIFLGTVSEAEKSALLTRCTAFVFPSILRSEAFGVSLLEAACYGKPLISTELGTGTSYINQHDVTGLVVPPNNATALQAAILALWQDPPRAAQFGQAARNRYVQLFQADTMAAAYANTYRALIEAAT